MSDIPSESRGPSSSYGERELANVAAALSRDRHPHRVGPYRIVELIGEGGMGSVYRAEQTEPIRRTVALKLIKVGFDSTSMQARFRSEQRLLAAVDHPNIARVLDAGTTDSGRPFIAIEFVDGQPVTRFADEQRLTLAERLKLMAQVCRTVEHAHRLAILHRDLKPSNILVTEVDGTPVVKVIDFGIAKLLDDALDDTPMLTADDQRVGTLDYMSPEQADGRSDIDTRSDVYALGVVLYELLTGCLPVDSAQLRSVGVVERSRRLREVDAPRPSTRLESQVDIDQLAKQRRTSASHLVQQLRRELDWIAVKALQKDRDDRYASAGEMADDLENFLHDRPLRAGPVTWTYRARKFGRRHRAGLTGAAVAAAILVAGVAGTAWQAVRATRAESLIRAQQQITLAEKARAVDAADAAREVNDFLVDMLNSADLNTSQGRDILVRDVLDSAAATIPNRFAERPAIEAELRSTIGSTYATLGLLDEADRHLVRALELRQSIGDAEGREVLRAMLALARLRLVQDRFEESRTLSEQVAQQAAARFGPDDPLVTNATGEFAVVLERLGDAERAETLFREIIATDRRTGRDNRREHFITIGNLAQMLRPLRRIDEAEELMQAAYAGMVALQGADDPTAIDMLGTYADILRYQRKFDQAEAMMREFVERSARVFGPDHRRSIVAEQGLAVVLDTAGRKVESLPYFVSSLERMRRVMGDQHTETLGLILTLAVKRTNDKAFAEAEPLFREAHAGWSKVAGPDHPNAISSLYGLTHVLSMQEKWADALDPARTLYDVLLEPGRVQIPLARRARFLSPLGIVLSKLDRGDEAVPTLKVAYAALCESGVASTGNPEAYESVVMALARLAEAAGDSVAHDHWLSELDRFK